jgi:hypothetical protein
MCVKTNGGNLDKMLCTADELSNTMIPGGHRRVPDRIRYAIVYRTPAFL